MWRGIVLIPKTREAIERDKEAKYSGLSLESAAYYFIFPDILLFEIISRIFKDVFTFNRGSKILSLRLACYLVHTWWVPDCISNTINYSNKDEIPAEYV